MRTAAQRILDYNARMQSSLIDPTNTAVNPVAQANFTTKTMDLYAKQQQLVNILNSNAVVSYQWARWFAMFGEMYKAYGKMSGGTIVLRFIEIVAKWEARGVGHGGAVQVAFDIFAVTIP
jgi:hypothetical protein